MRDGFAFACIVWLTSLALAQEPAIPPKSGDSRQSGGVSADSGLKDMFESKIKVEWEALKNKDKKGYAELLADDYEGVEVDGRGERNKIQSVNELAEQNVFNYTLWGLKLIPLGPDAALVIYESTVQFPPRAQIRYSRVYISELWVKRAGQWKELHYQETRVK
ncbi:MAG TPA: nuclear transport factor 2 family protein [Terriglobales bacterium]